MAILRVMRIAMPRSAVIADQIVNSFYFDTGGTTDNPAGAVTTNIASELDMLWNDATASGAALRSFVAENALSQSNETEYRFYNLDDPKPRPVIANPPAQHVTPRLTTEGLPNEVAVCLSFRGTILAGEVAARRRGRVYVGPLNIGATEFLGADGHARPAVALQEALVLGAQRMKDNLLTDGITWGVYSPTTRGILSAASAGFVPITHVWVDDAFDTQRRRGSAPTARLAIDV